MRGARRSVCYAGVFARRPCAAAMHGSTAAMSGGATMFTVYLVDDDPRVLTSLARLLGAKGYDVRPAKSADEFLQSHDPSVPGCAILDLSMPRIDGLKLQQVLAHDGVQRPIIFLSGTGDIPATVRAMRAGAVDFLTKPVHKEQLFQAISRAERVDSEGRQARAAVTAVQARLEMLTPRERQVLSHVIAGRLNKQIAGDLGTVEKTIKFHRGRMMKKLGLRTVADLVRFAEKAGITIANS